MTDLEIANATGYSLSSVKLALARLRANGVYLAHRKLKHGKYSYTPEAVRLIESELLGIESESVSNQAKSYTDSELIDAEIVDEEVVDPETSDRQQAAARSQITVYDAAQKAKADRIAKIRKSIEGERELGRAVGMAKAQAFTEGMLESEELEAVNLDSVPVSLFLD